VTPFGPKRPESTIGDYYERKREEANRAWEAVKRHRATCRDCVVPDKKGSHFKRCPEYRRLYERFLNAGNTGD
jgi:hypothetical protein